MSLDEFHQLKDSQNNFHREEDRESLEKNLPFVGTLGLEDEIRDTVPAALQFAAQNGINVRMISGDNIETAKTQAITAGILKVEEKDQKYVCMTGPEFVREVGGINKVLDKEGNERYEIQNKTSFKQIANRLKVLARSTPDDKYTLVCGLKELGGNVAATGESHNDA